MQDELPIVNLVIPPKTLYALAMVIGGTVAAVYSLGKRVQKYQTEAAAKKGSTNV